MTEADAARRLADVDRAAGELRRGRAVAVLDGAAAALVAAAEGLTDGVFAELSRAGQPYLLLTRQRASVLKVRTAGSDPVAIRAGVGRAEDYALLADPTADLDWPLRGPFTAERSLPHMPAAGAVALAKLAKLLPAAVAVPVSSETARAWSSAGGGLCVASADILAQPDTAAATLRQVAAARVPLAEAEHSRILAFRPADGSVEHLAIIVGDLPPYREVGPGPLVRLHSECFTGDLLASLKCDCGEQLRGAIALMAAEGGGILLYMAQEGRGIGLINKLRAYRLQDQGFDTVDANERLGFAADERLFRPAAEMLRQLGQTRIRLLTNNPEKVSGLAAEGIAITGRVAHAFPPNRHNEAYLETKRKRSGHYL